MTDWNWDKDVEDRYVKSINLHEKLGLEKRLKGQKTRIARIRRNKWVFIPPEWRGKTVDRQTRMKRPSKAIHKRRKELKHGPRRDTIRVKGASYETTTN